MSEARWWQENFKSETYLGGVDDGVTVDLGGGNRQCWSDVFDGFFASKSVSSNDGVGMNLLADEFFSSFQELSGENDDGGSSISDLCYV